MPRRALGPCRERASRSGLLTGGRLDQWAERLQWPAFGSEPGCVPVDARRAVEVLQVLMAQVGMDPDRVAASAGLDTLEVARVRTFLVNLPDQVQLPAFQSVLAEAAKGLHHHLVALRMAAFEEAPDREDERALGGGLGTAGPEVNWRVHDDRVTTPELAHPVPHVLRLADDALELRHALT